jgi:hypothetical protein
MLSLLLNRSWSLRTWYIGYIAIIFSAAFSFPCFLQGHAIHPSYTDCHEQVHRPEINGGLMVKTNAKQRYATDAIGTFLIRKLVEKRGGRVQEFEVRNDMYALIVLVH